MGGETCLLNPVEKAPGTTANRPWGNDVPNSSLANYNGNQGDTVEVGSYPQGVSHYGALDMAGNVWEWVRDWYEGYDANETNNPTGPSSGTYRVLHGGSWNNDTWSIRAANRTSLILATWCAGCFIGFRVSPPKAGSVLLFCKLSGGKGVGPLV